MIPLAWHLLQTTVFAAVIALLSLVFRHDRARTRHWLWMAASIKFFVPFSLLVSLAALIPWPATTPVPPPQMRFVMADFREPPAPVPSSPTPPPPPADHRTSGALSVLWFCGSAALLVRWHRRRERIASIIREATPIDGRLGAIPIAVPLLSSPDIPEPGVFGIFRPVLLLPAGIQRRLSPAQLEAVLAHELCHVRRRDNLAGAIHMLVECLFWFHPLVWWIGTRLVEDRELACDEEVVSRGADPASYAEGILKVCELCCRSPLPCVSGVTGADLIHRIECILAPHNALPLARGKRLLLALTAALALATPVVIGVTHAAHAQEPRSAAPLHFDVASVKPVDQPWLQVYPERSGGRIRWTTDLRYIVEYAYNLSVWRVSGPLPGSDHIYAFDLATSPSATDDQVRLMFQSLLADRFKMQVHRVTKEIEGYAITVARGGPKFTEAKTNDAPAPLPEWFRDLPAGDSAKMENKVVATLPQKGVVSITGRRATMLQFADSLQKVLRVAVLDQTGLTGKYYFAFQYAQEEHPDDVALPSLFTAIQKELGLKLEKHKGPVEMLVIDHIDKTPTEN